MAQLPDYITGTVSITNGSTALTGTGTAWSTADLKEGDIFYKAGYAVLIASVDSDTGITLADAWPGTTLADATYAIRFAPDNSRVQGQTRQLLDLWRQGIYVTPDAVGTLAGRDDYDDQPEGFKYLADDSDPWTLYAKVSNDSGDWSAGTAWGGPKGDQGLPGSSNVVGTSTTSLAIGTGAKTFAIAEPTRGWGVGARLRASSAADASNWMEGVVTAYADDSLTLSVDLVGGSGTKADWTINLAGERGMAGPESSGDGNIAVFDGTTGKTIKDSGSLVSDLMPKTGGTFTGATGGDPGTGKINAVDYQIGGVSIRTSMAATVATRTALAALDTTVIKTAYLSEAGRSGPFVFRSGDLSAFVTADTAQGVYVAPSTDTTGASGAWVRVEGLQGRVNVLWFGAIGDGTTHASAAIQAAIDYCKWLLGLSTTGANITLYVPQGQFYIDTSLDLTSIGVSDSQFQFVIVCDGILVGHCAGKAVVDMLGSRHMILDHLKVWGDQTDTPSVGIQIGRVSSGVNADRHSFRDVHVDGYFSLAGVYNFASETCIFLGLDIRNLEPDGYTLAQDGSNSLGITSEYVTISATANASVSFNENTFISPSLIQATSGPSVYIDGTARHRFIGGYVVSVDDVGFNIHDNASTHNTDLVLDCHGEATGMTSLVGFTSTGTSAVVTGLSIKDHSPQASNSIVSYGSLSAVRINDLDVQLYNNSSVPIFDNVSKFFIRGGKIICPSLSQLGTIANYGELNCEVSNLNNSPYYRASYGFLNEIGAVGIGSPVVVTAAKTIRLYENSIINNKSGSSNTVTLPNAADSTGRVIEFLNWQAQALVSASSNVVPQSGGSAGTAILPATAGAWAVLQSDGTNWNIMRSGS